MIGLNMLLLTLTDNLQQKSKPMIPFIGNLLTYHDGTAFTWEKGRLLGEARGNNRLEYIYDAAGNSTMLIYNSTSYVSLSRDRKYT